MPRFNKTWRAVAGKPGTKGLEIGYPLRVTFEIEKDAAEEPNGATLRFYNLSPATRKVFETPDTFVAFYAGYEQEHGALLLAAGNVVEGVTSFERPNVVTEVVLSDGYVNLRDSAVSVGYGPGVTSGAILDDLSRQMGLKLNAPADMRSRSWAHGFSHYGAAHVALHKVVQAAGLEWSIQDGVLQVIDRKGVTARRAVVLASDSGLVGTPKRTRSGAAVKATVKDQKTGENKTIASNAQQVDGWEVESLLLPGINPGDAVKIESRTVADFFRVDSLSHSGDSEGSGEWRTKLKVVDLDAPTKAKKAAKK